MYRATREVRFAVVLYGGTSLAIYMNGISQELLRMVRGSADPKVAGELDEVEKIYKEISQTLAGKDGGCTCFVVDIISGTSAGGINGVALARALVRGCQTLNALRNAWTEEADIGRLFNDRGILGIRGRKTESLLDGAHMYDMLLSTLRAMDVEATGTPLVQTLDLFVTATDLEGRIAPVQLTGKSVDERIHKSVFRFSHDEADEARRDFVPENDPMLAFAARCTSSFPIAFPPMRFNNLPRSARSGQEDVKRFFPGVGDGFEERLFADGGYLDNRPFSHAINLIPFRHASLPGERKLIFVDPFPEKLTAAAAAGDIDFLRNAQLAATTLPRREMIRDDIRAITAINRRLERLGALQARWELDQEKLAPLDKAAPELRKPDDLEKCDLADLVADKSYGRYYPLYHHLRVYSTTDTISNLVTLLAGYDPESDGASYLRQIIRAWRDRNFSTYHARSLETENAYLSRYDLDFRLRRLNHLRSKVTADLERLEGPDAKAGTLKVVWDIVEVELSKLRQLTSRAAIDRAELLPAEEIAALTKVLKAKYQAVMDRPDIKSRYEEAVRVYEMVCEEDDLRIAVRPLIDQAMRKLGKHFCDAFDASSAAIRRALDMPGLEHLVVALDRFHWHDITTFPFLEGTPAEEHSEVQVFRISPAESAINSSPAKLAGIYAGAFGGFLNRDWREHDILWGRLDGAEGIVTALMPRPDQEELRRAFIYKLQDAILRQEFGVPAGNGRRLALLTGKLRDGKVEDELRQKLAAEALGVTNPMDVDRERFKAYYGETQPIGPAAPEIARWSSRATAILARMIDDLPVRNGALAFAGPRLAGGLRTGGVLTARLAYFALPGGYPRLFGDRLLLLAFVVGFTLIASAYFTTAIPYWIGVVITSAALGAWFLIYAAGRVLRDQAPFSALVRSIAIALALALMALGAWTAWDFAAGRLAGSEMATTRAE